MWLENSEKERERVDRKEADNEGTGQSKDLKAYTKAMGNAKGFKARK